MNTQDKAKALAALMHWDLLKMTEGEDSYYLKAEPDGDLPTLEPYEDSQAGLAQFATILLEFPEVIEGFVYTAAHTDEGSTTAAIYTQCGGDYQGTLTTNRPVTQESLLDAVLKMNGVME